MRLGILVNSQRHLDLLVSISRAATAKGHEVSVFVMDKATRSLVDETMKELAGISGVDVRFCDYNAMLNEVPRDAVPEDIAAGSQFDNAVMTRDSHRVIVL